MLFKSIHRPAEIDGETETAIIAASITVNGSLEGNLTQNQYQGFLNLYCTKFPNLTHKTNKFAVD